MPLNIIHANRVETLAEVLAERIGRVPEGVGALAAETVVLDNPAMGAWVNLQLAQRHGIAANVDYQRLSQFFWRLARATLSDDIPETTPFNKQEMTWRMMAVMADDEVMAEPVMAPVQRYLAAGSNGESLRPLKQYQLSARVADLFDQYQVYRPEWLNEGWDQGRPAPAGQATDAAWHEAEAWQRRLWREMRARAGATAGTHRAEVHQALCERLSRDDLGAVLPCHRLFVFGVTTMPASVLEVIMHLARHIDVDLYLFNPCAEHWCDIPSVRGAVREQAARYATTRSEGPAPELGNPLLAAQGQQVRDFLELAYRRMDEFQDSAGIIDAQGFSAPDEARQHSLLAAVQQDIFELTFRGETAGVLGDAGQPLPVPPGEASGAPSIHVHSCHGPMREVEVLHDQLLDLFDRDPTLSPRDVVVMMPRVGPYIPYIQAVFERGDAGRRIDYHIADRTLVEASPVLNGFQVLMALPESRLPVSEVLGLLEIPALQRRFGLQRGDFERLREWVVRAGARWGVDAGHRQAETGVAYGGQSWSFAVDRMLAGYAMAGGEGHDVLGVQPMDEIEGGETAVFDGFLRFWRHLLQARQRLGESRTLDRWASQFTALLDTFFDPGEDDQAAFVELRQELEGLAQAGEQAWFDGEVPLAVARSAVQPALQRMGDRRHPFSEGVKFCSLLPMRGVPFRVVYLMGMDMESYPRRIDRPGFDLMSEHFRPGDRAARIDDRWLFLEALLSARQAFHVSYVGQDIHRNEPREPAVVVSELVDYLRDGYQTGVTGDDGGLVPGRWFTRHPLQPWDASLFAPGARDSGRRFSLQPVSYRVATGRQAGEVVPDAGRWDQPDSEWSTDLVPGLPVDVNDFVRFFTHPARWFFRQRDLALGRYDTIIVDEEMLDGGNGLDRWKRLDGLLGWVQAHANAGQALDDAALERQRQAYIEYLRACGDWPMGAAGDEERERLSGVSGEYLHFVIGAGEPRDIDIDLSLLDDRNPLRLRGRVTVHGDRFRWLTASRPSARDLLDFYLRVMLIGASSPEQGLIEAWAAFNEGKATVSESVKIYVEDDPTRFDGRFLAAGDVHRRALVQLGELFHRYRATGLPFHPGLSWQWPAKTEEERAWQARSAWYDGDFGRDNALRGDLEARAYYGGPDTFTGEAFVAVAEQLSDIVSGWLLGRECVDE